jgi:protein-tyrosine-phosphatase
MAEGWLRHLASDKFDVVSAGTQPLCRAVLTRIHDKAAAFDLVRRCWPSA